MAQKLIQTQEQRQLQQQRLSAQQMLQVRLLEMPITELEESINAELYDNPALEAAGERSVDDGTDGQDYDDSSSAADDFDAANERSDREEALDNALQGIGRDDDMPQASYQNHAADSKDYEEMVYGDNVSFYDRLKELGYYTTKCTGHMLSRTVSAVKEFQKDHGFSQNGNVDQNLLNAMAEAEKITPEPEEIPPEATPAP